MNNIKFSNLLNLKSKCRYWGLYIYNKNYSINNTTKCNDLTFEKFCHNYSKNFRLSELNHKII